MRVLALLVAVASFGAAAAGDPARGREIALGRDANCALCHDFPGLRVAGNVGPSLAGIGSRLAAAQLRARLEDPQRMNPETVMPSYSKVEGLQRVGKEWKGKPVLTTEQIDDVVAFLETLR